MKPGEWFGRAVIKHERGVCRPLRRAGEWCLGECCIGLGGGGEEDGLERYLGGSLTRSRFLIKHPGERGVCQMGRP